MSIEDNRALWGQGERKMNLGHWIRDERDWSSEDLITEPEQERDVIQEAEDMLFTKLLQKP